MQEGLPVAGKLGCRGVILAVRPSRLFFITDSVSNCHYLVDTGLAFSIMLWESPEAPAGPVLTAADGHRIHCWGEWPCTVTIAGVACRWNFLLAAVSFPIIVIDFLHHHSLLVDMANLHLLTGELSAAAVCSIANLGTQAAWPRSYTVVVLGSTPSSPGPSTPSSGFSPPSPGIASAAVPALPPDSDWAAALKSCFLTVFNPGSMVSLDHPPHGVQHLIITIGQPSTAMFHRLDPTRLMAAKARISGNVG
jgi:hypothetical protein